ncbi:hypothetical protein [Kitasatospora azatica]|uniref:hypothetical protein n=1 Tax=Kitasatospora azatica TaxID=58347 RepID=UPI00055B8216|nr:hypothetical protein [Kitasatospora azatica]
MDQQQAQSLAEAFCREQVPKWEVYGCRLTPAKGVALEGCYLFAITVAPDPDPRKPRIGLGGNYPVVVDRETGACRFVAGMTEYQSLRTKRRR